MAVSLAFGILFATVITLFLIPSLYLMLDDFKASFVRAWGHLLPGGAKKPESHSVIMPAGRETTVERIES